MNGPQSDATVVGLIWLVILLAGGWVALDAHTYRISMTSRVYSFNNGALAASLSGVVVFFGVQFLFGIWMAAVLWVVIFTHYILRRATVLGTPRETARARVNPAALPPLPVLAPAEVSLQPTSEPAAGESAAVEKPKSSLVKGKCEQCGRLLEFNLEMQGTTVVCPHCNKSTKLARKLVLASTGSQPAEALPPMSVLAPADASVKPNADPIDGETWAAVKAKDSLAKGQCEHCGGHLEFSKEMEGTNVTCPHCNKSIKLAQSLVSASTDSQSKKKSLPVGIAVVRQVQRSACGPPAGPAQAKASPASPPAEVRSLSVGPSAVSVFPADAPPTASPPGSSPTIGQPKAGPKLETELRELVYLKDLKLITEKDYEEKKRKLLGLD